MKSFLLSFTFIIAFLFTAASKDQKNEEKFKIEVRGKVAAVNTSKIVPAKVAIRAPGIALTLDTDSEGKFSTTFAAVSAFTVTVQSPGYEKLEQTLSIAHLNADSTIQISASLMPIEKTRLHGMIFDKKTSKPIKAEFDLYMDNDIIKEDVEIVDNGKYNEVLTKFGWYIIDVSAKGYLNFSDTVWVMNCKRPDLQRDYYLIPIEAGLIVRLKNIQFNFGKTTLHPDSFEELSNVIELLQKNPGLKLEIGGHTDSDGPDDYNLWLSQARAQSVVDYLISQGATTEQLVAKGYGETKPIDTHDTQSAKSTNRRVEFTVLAN